MGDANGAMSFLDLFTRPKPVDSETREREGARLDAKRKHLRGKMAKTQSELRRAWTDFRNEEDAKEKKALRAKIKHLEAERKSQVKDMLRIQAEMKKLGYESKAGYVHMS